MKYTGPKAKLSRRLGIAITPKTQKYLETRPTPPGMHGRSRRPGKMSDYGRQLVEKQRLRFQYNISEKQLRNYYHKASKKSGSTPDNLIHLLESRLDALVLRAGFARSIFAARQFVGHGHVQVNGKKVNIPSYGVKPGDVISIREKSKKSESVQYALQDAPERPAYLKVDRENLTAEYLQEPAREEIPVICEVSTVVEFYSR